jgi:hypothetical protein
MFTIPGLKGNANQNHTKIPPSRTPPTINVGGDVGKKEPSYTAGRNVSYYHHYGKQYKSSFKKSKNRSAIAFINS